MAKKKSKFLSGRKIDPQPISVGMNVADLVDGAFLAYNAARLREACQLYTTKMLEPDVTVGVSLTGALTPAGLGISALIPLIKAGFIDWIVSTGANLYHDTHFGIGLSLHQGSTAISDIVLRDEEVVRIYDFFSIIRSSSTPTRSFAALSKLRSFRSRCLRLNSITSVAGISGNEKKNSVSKINLCWRLPTNMEFRFTPPRPAIHLSV